MSTTRSYPMQFKPTTPEEKRLRYAERRLVEFALNQSDVGTGVAMMKVLGPLKHSDLELIFPRRKSGPSRTLQVRKKERDQLIYRLWCSSHPEIGITAFVSMFTQKFDAYAAKRFRYDQREGETPSDPALAVYYAILQSRVGLPLQPALRDILGRLRKNYGGDVSP